VAYVLFESSLCNMDTVWRLDFATRLSPSLIREIYHLAKPGRSKPKLVKHALDAHIDWVLDVAWAPDGTKFVTVSTDNSFKMWDPDGNQLKHVLNAHTRWITGVVWVPDGSTFVTVSWDKSFKIWTGS
jgi:WD40 repeat protein